MTEKISICLNRGREESVSNDGVSIVCTRKYEVVRMTLRQKIPKGRLRLDRLDRTGKIPKGPNLVRSKNAILVFEDIIVLIHRQTPISFKIHLKLTEDLFKHQ